MKKNFKFIVAAIAAVAMIGCTKDGGNTGKVKEGIPTNAVIKIALPSTTRADYDAIVEPGESTIVDAWVFIFNKNTGRLTQKAPLTGAATGTATTVATTTGPKILFVAINAGQMTPAVNFETDTFYKVDDATIPQEGVMLDAFMKHVSLTLPTNLPAVSGKFLMTGYREDIVFEAPTAAIPTPTANQVKIGVGRGVAKVFMSDKPNVSALEATQQITFKKLGFEVMNNPVEMYAFQKWSQSETTPSGTITNKIVDPTNGNNRSLYYRTLATYTPAGVATPAPGTLSAGLYVPENWPEGVSYARNATSLLIQGEVTFGDKSIVVNNNGTATSPYVDGQTFWRVWQKDKSLVEGGKWLPTYFGEVPDMAAVRLIAGITGSGPTSAFSPKKVAWTTGTPGPEVDYEFFIAEYTNAKCYWTLALYNPEQNNRHVVARNDAFHVTIATIKDIGAHTEDDDNDDDGVIPDNPPIDEVEVDVTVEIEMLKWHGILQEGNI